MSGPRLLVTPEEAIRAIRVELWDGGKRELDDYVSHLCTRFQQLAGRPFGEADARVLMDMAKAEWRAIARSGGL